MALMRTSLKITSQRLLFINTYPIQHRLHAQNFVKLRSVPKFCFCSFAVLFCRKMYLGNNFLNSLLHKPSHQSRNLCVHLYSYLAVTKQRNNVRKAKLELDLWVSKDSTNFLLLNLFFSTSQLPLSFSTHPLIALQSLNLLLYRWW